jgi:hypothetical protein
MEKRTILVLLGLLVMPFAAAYEAYVWTDEDGVVHYSDRPVPGARRIELSEPNASDSLVRRPAEAEQAGEDEGQADAAGPFRYESFEIVSPGAEDTLWNIEGVLNVSMALSPPLQPGHQVRVYFDGNPQTVSGTSVQLQEVWRGVHNLQAEVLDETGKMLIRSRTNRFYVQQTTVR